MTNTFTNVTTYTRTFGNEQTNNSLNPPAVTYMDTGNYNIVLIADNGVCKDTGTTTITVAYLPEIVIVIPNGDNANDEYFIYTENAKTVFVEIFNRWRELTIKLESPTAKWDCKKAIEGVYFYKYSITDLKDEKHEGHGFFHLARDK